MNKQLLHFILLTLLSLYPSPLPLHPTTAHAQTPTDVTSKIENLGNPTKTRWADNTDCVYARNVWDMQSYLGKLYIGSGNSSNAAPCINAGPVPVISYNQTTNQYLTEYTVADEQIDVFRILDFGGTQGVQLVIPSHDPKSNNTLAWSGLRNGTWRRHEGTGQLTTGAVHTYDIVAIGSKTLAGGGVFALSGNTADVNDNGGEPWTLMPSTPYPRGYTIFILGGVGYVSGLYFTDNSAGFLYAYSGPANTITSTGLKFNTIFTNTLVSEVITPYNPKSGKIQHPTNFGSNIVYIGAAVVNDHQGNPFGLYKMSQLSPTGGANISSVSRLTLPGNPQPWDILAPQNGKLYVLGSIKNASRYWITVSSTSDLTNWTEEFRFDSPTFARSFEQLGGDFYFGLGTDTTPLSPATGDILRYKLTSASTPSPSVSTKPGDTDGDNDVDIFDYNQLLTDFGKKNDPLTKSDLDNDDDVDIFDYNILLTNFGK